MSLSADPVRPALVVCLVFSCAGVPSVLLADTIVAWGYNGYGQADPPPGDDFAALGPGWGFGLAIREDRSLVGWGLDDYGQTEVPTGSDFADVAGGYRHAVALRTDGSLTAWGWNSDGQTDVPVGNDYVAVTGGWRHSLALNHNVDARQSRSQCVETERVVGGDEHGRVAGRIAEGI